MLLYFYAPFAWEAFSENCKGKSVVGVGVAGAADGDGMVMCWLWVATSAGNDKLSTHLSFIFNTFD